jgi:hypothetical protein
MIVYVTLPGYDPRTSETDHLVKWVQADSVEQVAEFLKRHSLSGELVRSGHPDQHPAEEAFAYGVDVVLSGDSEQWCKDSSPRLWLEEARDMREKQRAEWAKKIAASDGAPHRPEDYADYARRFVEDIPSPEDRDSQFEEVMRLLGDTASHTKSCHSFWDFFRLVTGIS